MSVIGQTLGDWIDAPESEVKQECRAILLLIVGAVIVAGLIYVCTWVPFWAGLVLGIGALSILIRWILES